MSRIAVGDRGGWAFAAPRLTGAPLTVVDSGHPDGLNIGTIGEGPGEARMLLPLNLNDSTVIGFDLATGRLSTWYRSGLLKVSNLLGKAVDPFLAIDSDTLVVSRGGGAALYLAHKHSFEGSVSASDSLVESMFGDDGTAGNELVNIPVLGRWAGGTVIGDGRRYLFGLYDIRGRLHGIIQRDLPTRHRTPAEIDVAIERERVSGLLRHGGEDQARERLAGEELPWVSHLNNPRPDGSGRLWIIRSNGADSALADIYADTTLLGTLAMPCPQFAGQWDLKGRTLGLVCSPSDTTSVEEADVKLYRIVDEPMDD